MTNIKSVTTTNMSTEKILEEFDEKFRDCQFILNNFLGNPIGLSPKEIKCLQLRKDGKTLEEVGKEFGVTRERVRQIEAKATERIKIKHEIKAFIATKIHQEIAEERKRVREMIESKKLPLTPAEIIGLTNTKHAEIRETHNFALDDLLSSIDKLTIIKEPLT